MKMVKKSLLGLVVAAMVLSLTGCGVKDDTEGIIKGTAGNYTVNYTYDAAEDTEYRAYKSTGAKHAGALVKISFDKDDIANAGNSKFGLIFGLDETKQGDSKIRNFYIVGFGANGNYYVSKYENVVNIRDYNFGASTSATGTNPKETIISTNGNSNGIVPNTTIYGGEGEDKYVYIWYQAYANGSYEVKIGNVTDENVNAWKSQTDGQKIQNPPVFSDTIKSYTISNAFPTCSEGSEPQKYAAVYTRVQGGATLHGKVNFKGDYKEAEDIEMID